MPSSVKHPSFVYSPRIPLLLIGLLCVSPLADAMDDTIKPVERTLSWLQDYSEALKTAMTSKRPVWIQFTGPWCPNCHKMDRETFKHPKVIDAITKYFVAAKISCENNVDLALSFGFTQLPATVLIGTDGKILARHEGFADVEALGKLTTLAGITVDADLAKPVSEPLLAEGSKSAQGGADLVDRPRTEKDEPIQIAQRQPESETLREKALKSNGDTPPVMDAGELNVALKPATGGVSASGKPMEPLGIYCPVTLLERALLMETDSQHTAVYAGRRYYFADAGARQRFAKSPERFVPVRGGECLVSLVENKREVQGLKDFPLVYDSKIFLCASQEQRERFLNAPARYALKDIRQPGVCPHCKAPMGEKGPEKSWFQLRFGGSRYQFPDRAHMEAFLLSPLKYLR